MKCYVFTGSIHIEADSPKEAAKEFWRTLHAEQTELKVVVEEAEARVRLGVVHEFNPAELI